MRNATPWLLALALVAPLGTTALAQTAADTVQVTFQVDLSDPIAKGAFADTNVVSVRGTFNNYDADSLVMSQVGESDIYAATTGLAKGDTVAYKFWSDAVPLGWEDNVTDEDPNFGNDRDYIVPEEPTGDITLDAVPFNKEVVAVGGSAKYRITFTVDMSVAALNESTFDADGDDFVVVAGDCKPDSLTGCLNGWSTTADTLEQDFFNPNLYSGVVEVDKFPVPAEGDRPNVGYKFVVGATPGTAPGGWESIDDRILEVPTEGETDDEGFIEVVADTVFYNNVDDSGVFTEETTIAFEVDLRPAYYYVADNGNLPSDTQTSGASGSTVDGLALNGPAAGQAASNETGIADWADWGNTLAQIPARNFVDDGTQGDATAGDSIWTQQFTYNPGTAKQIVGKFGVNGFDNEGGFGANQNFDLGDEDGDGRVQVIFGAIRQGDGTFTDLNGPSVGGGDPQPVYDPYLAIPDDSLSVTVVRRGAESTSIEPGAGVPNGAFVLSGASPNPSGGVVAFSYELTAAGPVALSVFDVQGREVARLFDGTQAAGTYDVTFDGSQLAAGVYLYRLAAGGQVATRQLVIVR